MIAWQFYDKAVAVAARRLGDPDLARDTVLDVLTKLSDAEQVQETHVMAMLRYRIMDAQRKRGRGPQFYSFDEERDGGATHSTPEQELSAKQETQAVRVVVGDRAADVLHYSSEGYSDEEIGGVLGESADNVRQIRSRARAKLRSDK